MTLRTALVVDGDSEGAQRALAELGSSLDRAERSTEDAGKEWVRASVGLERLRVAQEQAAAAGITLSAEQERAAMHGHEIALQQTKAVTAMQRVTVSAGAQRAGMQQLAFQLGDVATMFAMGAPAMRIFASQGTQVIQSIGLMRGSAGGLIGFLSGPWGVGLSAGAVMLVPLIERLFETRDAANEAGDALKDAVKQFQSSLAQTSALTGVLTQASKDRATALGEVARLNREIKRLENGVDAGAIAGVINEQSLRDLDRLTAERDAQQAKADAAARTAREQMADAALAARRDAALPANDNSAGSRSSRSSGAVRTRAAAISDEAKALETANQQTERFIAGLEDEIAKIGLDAAGLRQLEVARASEAAQTDDQRKRIADLNQERERGLAAEAARQRVGAIANDNTALAGEIAGIEREARVLGLTGVARERALLAMEREAAIRPLLAELADAEAKGLDTIAKGLREQIDLLNAKYGLQIQIGDEAARIEAEAAATDRLMDGYHQLGEAGVDALSAIALHGEDAGDVIERLALSIADAALQATLLGSGPLAGLFGGGGGPVNLLPGSGGGILGAIGRFFGGGRANGGPVSPGQFYAVNETSTAPGLFFPIAPGRIEPAGNDNGRSGPIVIQLHVARGELFDVQVAGIAGDVAVQVVRDSAPALVEVAAAETTRRLTRPRM